MLVVLSMQSYVEGGKVPLSEGIHALRVERVVIRRLKEVELHAFP
jgi:hypothetical protein